jgi:tRNA(fMet)-specific endonuclease VapC
MIVLDTDHLSVYAEGFSADAKHLMDRLTYSGEPYGTTIISVEEQMRGWLALIRRRKQAHKQIGAYSGLQNIVQLLADWTILEWNGVAADAFDDFKRQKIRVGTMDLKIAAIAVSTGALLLSRNLADFEQIPGLNVENWID